LTTLALHYPAPLGAVIGKEKPPISRMAQWDLIRIFQEREKMGGRGKSSNPIAI
jgi:hypothetical protein